MSEMDQVAYVAIVTISLPGVDGAATAHVALAPADTIAAGGHLKPLHECTLADLRAFANELEAEVWETYQAIKLIDLARDERASVNLTILDEGGQPVAPSAEWFQKALVLPAAESKAANAEEPATQTGANDTGSPETKQTPSPVAEQLEPAAETGKEADDDGPVEAPVAEPALPTESASPAVDTSEPDAQIDPVDIVVSEPEAVHVERDEEPQAVTAGRDREAEMEAEPTIVPSKARVRVAGRRRRPGDMTWKAVDILIDEPALRATQAHALSSPDREVAGVLVGPRPEKQPDGRYLVHVIDSIIAKHTVMHGASVTYTPESWRYVNDKLAERYPDETAVMVGWYHTHPGFGIFLSGMDLFIHQNFFTQIWHVAFVLDPRAHTSGFFCWDRQKSQVSPYDFPWPMWAAGSW